MRPRLTSTRTAINTKKTFITCGYRHRVELHPRRRLQRVQHQHQQLRLPQPPRLLQRLPQRPQLHLQLRSRPDRHLPRGVGPRRGVVPLRRLARRAGFPSAPRQVRHGESVLWRTGNECRAIGAKPIPSRCDVRTVQRAGSCLPEARGASQSKKPAFQFCYQIDCR